MQKPKQTSLDVFIHGKRHKQKKNYHQSSRQNSDTQVIEQFYQYIPKGQQNQNKQLVSQFVLIGPFDTVYAEIIKKKLKNIVQNYSKERFFQYIQGNYKYLNIKNIDNLKQIKDKKFFQQTAPKMLKMLSEHGQTKIAKIKTLPKKSTQVIMISRQQALLILISMFIGIMPSQSFEFTTTFGYFLNFNNAPKKSQVQKLKCIINYFNMSLDQSRKTLQEEFITFQRATGYLNLDSQNYDKNIPLKSVKVEQKKIQQYYKKAAMVDFANSRIGGGVLKNGCVQQEILFVIFPEAIVSKLISYEMGERQAIIMYGLKRFSKYRNYSYDFQYDGPFYLDQSKDNQRSIMIAIDAINYNQKYSTNVQYCKSQTHRQIIKAFIGFNAISFEASQMTKICTGRWGCGAFKGDQVWKFLIQWIACSEAGRQMIYLTDDDAMVKKIERLVNQLIDLVTSDLLAILQTYGKALTNKEIDSNMSILEYIKKYV